MSDPGDKGKIITGDEWKRRPGDQEQGQGGASEQPAQPGPLSSDADWKAQARAEKERLAREAAEGAEEKPAEAEGGGREMPPANFQTLLSTIASQALLYMGAIPDPMTGQRMAHLELARHHIDLLGVLQEKTSGNLDEEEDKMISQTVQELRMYFTQVSEQLARQQQQQQQAGGQNPLGGAQGGPQGPLGGQGGPLG